ncbi:MAG: siroheme synthase [Pseudomonadota bacterium]
MDHMPIFMALKTRRALVVGGGQLASRKATLVLNACPHVEVLSDAPGPAMQRLIATHGLTQHSGPFTATHLDGVALVIAATDDDALNRAVFAAASARGVPVNVADQPALCSFVLPAIVDRAPVTVAVSTGGRSPVLARHVKALLERALHPKLGGFAAWWARWRQPVRDALEDERDRRRFWERVIDGPVGDLALTDPDLADNEIQSHLDNPESAAGNLRVVGVLPDDVDNITIAAHRALTRGDLVLVEPDANRDILQLCRREADVRELSHVANAEWIAEQVRTGRRVVLIRHQSTLATRVADTRTWRNAGLDARVYPAVRPQFLSQPPHAEAA